MVVFLEVFHKLLGKVFRLFVISLLIRPAVLGSKDFAFNARAGLGYVKTEIRLDIILNVCKAAVKRGGNHRTGSLKTHSLAGTVPAGVYEVNVGTVFLDFFAKELSVNAGLKREERRTEAGGESGNGVGYTALGTRDFGGIARNEVIHSLFLGEFGNGRQYAVSIRSKEDYGLGMSAHGRNDRVVDEIDGVRNAGVFGKAVVGVIGNSGFRVYDNVFHHCAVTDCAVNFRLLFLAEVDTFCVASALDIKMPLSGPAVLVVAR